MQIIQDAGAPIDGVGFQAHLIVGSTPSRANLATTLKRFTSLGVEVAYTELDIRHSSVPASESALTTQANDYANVVGSCLDVAGCVGITVWELTDKYSWVPNTFSGAGEACIYDEDLNKKVAWTSISSVLAAAATAGSGASTVVAQAPTTTLITKTTAAATTAKTSTAVATSAKSSTATTKATTSASVKTSTTAASSSATSSVSSNATTVPRWGQCGGKSWTGATTCEGSYKCTVANEWYSQCL